MSDRPLYDLFGLSLDASPKEIKTAYRRMANETHPDKFPGDPTKAEKFRAVSEAYNVLKDPERRAHYDKTGTIRSSTSELMQTAQARLLDLIENSIGAPIDLVYQSPLDVCREALENAEMQINMGLQQQHTQRERFTTFKARFKGDLPQILERMDRKVAECTATITNLEREQEILAIVKGLFKDYSYQTDQQVVQVWHGNTTNMSTGTMPVIPAGFTFVRR